MQDGRIGDFYLMGLAPSYGLVMLRLGEASLFRLDCSGGNKRDSSLRSE